MKVPIHVIASLALAAALYPAFSWKVLLVLAGGVLIDIDHYFWYVHKYKKFNLFQSYCFFAANTLNFNIYMGALFVFHSIEFLVISTMLSFYNEFMLLFTSGLILHHLLDLIWHYLFPKRFILDYSIIHCIIKNKIQKA